jgi:hypothetical protein
MTVGVATLILALAAAPASAHRLDEYLQATLISVDKDRLEAQMTLTPGVAVYPFIVADIDTDGNGVISEAEQRAYAARVLRDLSLTSDGRPLAPQLLAVQFPALDEMKEGRGEIRLDFSAVVPHGGGNRRITIENHHQGRISAYLVNCLVPRDPNIRIVAQTRNYTQSQYGLEYAEAGKPSVSRAFLWWGPVALLLLARLLFLRTMPESVHAD